MQQHTPLIPTSARRAMAEQGILKVIRAIPVKYLMGGGGRFFRDHSIEVVIN